MPEYFNTHYRALTRELENRGIKYDYKPATEIRTTQQGLDIEYASERPPHLLVHLQGTNQLVLLEMLHEALKEQVALERQEAGGSKTSTKRTGLLARLGRATKRFLTGMPTEPTETAHSAAAHADIKITEDEMERHASAYLRALKTGVSDNEKIRSMVEDWVRIRTGGGKHVSVHYKALRSGPH